MSAGLGRVQLRVLTIIANSKDGITCRALKECINLNYFDTNVYRVVHSLYLRDLIMAVHPAVDSSDRYIRAQQGTHLVLTARGAALMAILPPDESDNRQIDWLKRGA